MKLSNGKVVKANAGIIGLDENLDVFEGYDGRLIYDEEFDYEGLEDLRPIDTDWAQSEKLELADLMIQRWQNYKAKHRG